MVGFGEVVRDKFEDVGIGAVGVVETRCVDQGYIFVIDFQTGCFDDLSTCDSISEELSNLRVNLRTRV